MQAKEEEGVDDEEVVAWVEEGLVVRGFAVEVEVRDVEEAGAV